jgi:hypothetical protein
MFRFLLVLLAGCSSFIANKAADTTLDIIGKSAKVAARESDLEIAKGALPGALFQLGAMQMAYPDRHEFRDLHANALCQYSTAFVFDDWEDASLGGRDTTELSERLDKLLDRCLAEQQARLPAGWKLETATAEQSSIILSMASARAVRLALAPFAHMTELPEVQAMLQKCAALTPGAHDAGAETLLAVLIAGKAQLLGGPDGSAEFAAAKKLAPESLSIDVLFARTRKDRALFEAGLTAALAVDVAKWPEHRLANELARKKAKRYLAHADKLLPQ